MTPFELSYIAGERARLPGEEPPALRALPGKAPFHDEAAPFTPLASALYDLHGKHLVITRAPSASSRLPWQ